MALKQWLQRISDSIKTRARRRASRRQWIAIKADERTGYRAELQAIDSKNKGMEITCPKCQVKSWVRFSLKANYYHSPLEISCPADCGHYGHLSEYSPKVATPLAHLKTINKCRRDKTETRVAARMLRCPSCAIENPRAIMEECVNRVKSLPGSPSQDDLAEKLGSVVSVFDGVMRASNRIAVRNKARAIAEFATGSVDPHRMSVIEPREHPVIKSFQNIVNAQVTLEEFLDLKKCVDEWQPFVVTFQKRHAQAHALGVADADFMRKAAADPSAAGRLVDLTRSEVVTFAENCDRIVKSYFGHFLS